MECVFGILLFTSSICSTISCCNEVIIMKYSRCSYTAQDWYLESISPFRAFSQKWHLFSGGDSLKILITFKYLHTTGEPKVPSVPAHPSRSVQRCYPNSSLVSGQLPIFCSAKWGVTMPWNEQHKPLKIGLKPKRKFHFPIIHFQETYLSFRAWNGVSYMLSGLGKLKFSSELHLGPSTAMT